MAARDRTIPISRPRFAEPAPSHNPHRFRIIDGAFAIAIIGAIFSAGVGWNQFLNDGKRLDDHEQEIRALTQLQQQQQQTMAALSQNVSDIKESLAVENHR